MSRVSAFIVAGIFGLLVAVALCVPVPASWGTYYPYYWVHTQTVVVHQHSTTIVHQRTVAPRRTTVTRNRTVVTRSRTTVSRSR